MAKRFDGKVVVVTGAASGIGNEIARRFVDEGAQVVIFDISNAEAAAKEIGAAGYEVDVSDPAAWESTLKQVVDRFGGLHVVVNNAGVVGLHEATNIPEYPPEEIERVFKTNFGGAFLGIKFGTPLIRDSGGGAIVNISSGAAARGERGFVAYNASKAAIDSLTRCAAAESSKDGVRVNSILPGAVDTPMFRASVEGSPEWAKTIFARHPIGRAGKTQEIAAAVAFLASDDAGFITGANIPVDGGYLAA